MCVLLLQEKDLESFKDFVSRKRPEAIALAAESRYIHIPVMRVSWQPRERLHSLIDISYTDIASVLLVLTVT